MEQHLSLYRIFYTVANTGNISQAAKQLYNSQPAISKSISRLEENLGVTLFARSSRGVTLTEEGRVLYDHVKSAFKEIDEGEEKIRRMNLLNMGTLHIGVSNTLCKFVMLPYLQAFMDKYPHMKIFISCQSSNKTMKLLDESKIDLGLVAHPRSLSGLNFFSLGKIHDVFVTTPSYLERLNLTPDEIQDPRILFSKATLLLLDQNNMTRQYIDDYITSNNFTINNTIEATSMELLIEFAKIGLGIGCVIREFVSDEIKRGELYEIPLFKPIFQREIGFTYQKKRAYEKSLQHFIEFYKSYEEPV